MAKMSIWGAIAVVLVFKGLAGIDCADSVSLSGLLSRYDPISQTQQQLKILLPGFLQEKINRDNQTARFIDLEASLENLNRCNRTNREEVSNKIKTVFIKEVELLSFELYDLIRSSYLIIVAVLSIGQLDLITPPCTSTGGQLGNF